MPQPATTPHYDSAPRPPWWSRNRVRLAACLLVAGVAVAGICYGPGLWRSAWLRHWQHQCANYTLPPNTLIYTENALDAPALLDAAKPYQRLLAIHEAPSRIARQLPPCWTSWRPAVKVVSPYPQWPCHLLFLHERITATDLRQIVMVGLMLKESNGSEPPPTQRFWIVGEAITVPPEEPDPILKTTFSQGQGGMDGVGGVPFAADHVLRIFAGQADPKDPSRFSIPWECDGVRHEIIGTITEVDGYPGLVRLNLSDTP